MEQRQLTPEEQATVAELESQLKEVGDMIDEIVAENGRLRETLLSAALKTAVLFGKCCPDCRRKMGEYCAEQNKAAAQHAAPESHGQSLH